MKRTYPKKWLEATGWKNKDVQIAALDGLFNIGALNEPPKLKEFWLCTNCQRFFSKKVGGLWHCCANKNIIHTREVINEN